jgi:acyl dehydratase
METGTVPHPRGGLYFEDFSVGQVFRHRLTRTVTQMDNMLFSNMTLNPQPAAHRRAFLRDRDRMGPAADELAVHARPHDRHFGQ